MSTSSPKSKVKSPWSGRRKSKVFVGMSGGVDSSVTAALLKERGFEVVGVHLKCWSGNGPDASVGVNCTAEQDAEDARRAAETLKIPFYVFDMEQEYKDKVVEYMVDGYKKGITPNPDVMCNKEIKFGLFLKKALELGADYVATGHYVIKSEIRNPKSETILKSKNSNKKPVSNFKNLDFEFVSNFDIRASHFSLSVARDAQKDQSYFLWTLTQKQLKHCLFPIGDYQKSEVRKIARKYKLPNADKKDSQGICFLGHVTLKDFLADYIPEKKGIVVTTAGKIIGEHSGAHLYTIGQRHGLHLSSRPRRPRGVGAPTGASESDSAKKPLYVAEKDVENNALLVAEDGDPILSKKEVSLTGMNFISPLPSLIRANRRIVVWARVRYRQPLFKAELVISKSKLVNKKSKNNPLITNYKLLFTKPIKFVAQGQSAVMYERRPSTSSGLKMLGGGIIL